MKRSILCLVVALLAACSTVHQSIVAPKATVAAPQPVKTATGYLIDAATRVRYNALISVYGAAHYDDGAPVFIPAKRKDDGLTDLGNGQWLMTYTARVDFAELKAMALMAFPVPK